MEFGRIVRRREHRHPAMRSQCKRFLLSMLTLVLVNESAAVPNLRGVAPQDEKYYQSAIIRCRDGSKTFPQERLNDDFCDCVDGTDEPGTNACPEAKFYCKNWGYRPVILFSSWVNDGICDCCDGSDEFDGKIKCSNTCQESGKQSNEKLKKKLGTFKEGSTIRKRDVENARKLRQGHELELMHLKGEEKTLKDTVANLKVEKEGVEKAEKHEQEERREKEEQERRKKEKSAANEKPEQAEESSSQVEVPSESPKEGDTAETDMAPMDAETDMAPMDAGIEAAPKDARTDAVPEYAETDTAPVDAAIDTVPLVAAREGLDYLSEAERGRVVASRWTGADVSDILSKQDLADHHSDDEDDDANDKDTDEDDDYDVPHVSPSDTLTPFSSESMIGERSLWWSRLLVGPQYILQLFRPNRLPVNKSEAERIRKEYQESYAKLISIKSRITELQSRTKEDFGKEGEFYAFYDSCFELKDKKYVYKVCPYKDATQVEGYSTTRLGCWLYRGTLWEPPVVYFGRAVNKELKSAQSLTRSMSMCEQWQGFKEDYKEMIFQNGDKCWNGPERSLWVKMRCGTKLELRSVDEPSRCEYVAEFSTPALCTDFKVQALEEQLSQKDHEALSLHDEL